MTAAKAQAVASALIGAGYPANADQMPDASWAVAVFPPAGPIDVQLIASFATAQGVAAKIPNVTFT